MVYGFFQSFKSCASFSQIQLLSISDFFKRFKFIICSLLFIYMVETLILELFYFFNLLLDFIFKNKCLFFSGFASSLKRTALLLKLGDKNLLLKTPLLSLLSFSFKIIFIFMAISRNRRRRPDFFLLLSLSCPRY